MNRRGFLAMLIAILFVRHSYPVLCVQTHHRRKLLEGSPMWVRDIDGRPSVYDTPWRGGRRITRKDVRVGRGGALLLLVH